MDEVNYSLNMYINIDIVVLYRFYNYYYFNSYYIVIFKDILLLFEYLYIVL